MTARDPAQAALAEPCEAAPLRCAAIRVRTEPCEVAAFLRETGGAGTGDFVPLTFPFRWLALPEIRRLILQSVGGEGFLPLHEAQSFTYEKSLRTGADYLLAIEAGSSEMPPRLNLTMTIFTVEGEICARLETVLRIVRLTVDTDS